MAVCQERLRGRVFVAGIIGDGGDPSPVLYPLVVVDHVVTGIGQLNLLGEERDGDPRTMLSEMSPLRGIGGVRGGAYGQFPAEFYMNICGLLVEVAKDAFWLLGALLSMW
jgi:hypothetical protein